MIYTIFKVGLLDCQPECELVDDQCLIHVFSFLHQLILVEEGVGKEDSILIIFFGVLGAAEIAHLSLQTKYGGFLAAEMSPSHHF